MVLMRVTRSIRHPWWAAVTAGTTVPVSTVVVSTVPPMTTQVPTTPATPAPSPVVSPVPSPSSSAPAGLAPTTTAFPPTPTLYPPEDPRAVVEAAYNLGEQTWVGCLANLAVCDAELLFPAVFTEVVLNNTVNLVRNFRDAGYQSLGAADYSNTVSEVVIDGGRAYVTFCANDPIEMVLFGSSGSIVDYYNQGVESRFVIATMSLGEDGIWRKSGSNYLESTMNGEDLCD